MLYINPMNSCPACKSSSTKYFEPYTINQDISQNILPTTFRILTCENCNLYFKDYIPSDSEISNFYNSLGDNEWNYKQILPHEKYLRDILKDLPSNSSVLDIGCNTGRLLKDETKRLRCYGVEINLEAAKIAELSGVKIVAPEVKSGNLGENIYDLITLIDVFEHLNDPLPFIDQLVKALKPRGKLYIFTGRTDCLPSYLCGSYYWYYKPAQHLIFLNKKFINWYKGENRQCKVSVYPMPHFYSNVRTRLYQIAWHFVWRFFSPNSPYRILSIGKFAKMKEPFMITSWKDHLFFIIQKNSH